MMDNPVSISSAYRFSSGNELCFSMYQMFHAQLVDLYKCICSRVQQIPQLSSIHIVLCAAPEMYAFHGFLAQSRSRNTLPFAGTPKAPKMLLLEQCHWGRQWSLSLAHGISTVWRIDGFQCWKNTARFCAKPSYAFTLPFLCIRTRNFGRQHDCEFSVSETFKVFQLCLQQGSQLWCIM